MGRASGACIWGGSIWGEQHQLLFHHTTTIWCSSSTELCDDSPLREAKAPPPPRYSSHTPRQHTVADSDSPLIMMKQYSKCHVSLQLEISVGQDADTCCSCAALTCFPDDEPELELLGQMQTMQHRTI